MSFPTVPLSSVSYHIYPTSPPPVRFANHVPAVCLYRISLLPDPQLYPALSALSTSKWYLKAISDFKTESSQWATMPRRKTSRPY